MITIIREYTRPNASISWYGTDSDTSVERKESLAFIVDFHKNVIGLGDRYSLDYGSPDSLVATVNCLMTEEERNLLLAAHDDVNGQFYFHMNKHDFYYEENGITFVYKDI